MYIIKNVDIYTPAYIGKKDVLMSNHIEMIEECIDIPGIQVVDGHGLKMVPGFIDQHIHITGGGGEGSFKTKAPEIQLSKLIEAGITSVVGLLGTDGISRNVENLLSKTKALKEEGISVYCLSGSYQYPPITITGDVKKDIMFIDEIIGCKLALSDHRSTHIQTSDLIKLASDIRVSAMLSGKPGILVLHMGDEETGLNQVFEALEHTKIPVTMFRPTHVTRTKKLLEDSIKLLSMGGYIDMTASFKYNATKAIHTIKERGLDASHVTVSSDGQGSWSNYDSNGVLLEIGVSSVYTLYEEFLHMLESMPIEEALTYFTSNVADSLKLPHKGMVQVGNDADVLLLDQNNHIHSVFALGQMMMNEYKILKKGTYE